MEVDKAFETVYEANAQMVYWLSYGITHNRDTAADITQITFLRAFERREQLYALNEAQLRGWLCTTCRNETVSRLRRESKLVFMGEMPERAPYDPAGSLEDEAEEKLRCEWVWRHVEALPEAYRKAVLLYYFAGLSGDEAARALRIPAVTFRSHLKRARGLLKAAMEKEAYPDEDR